MRCRVLLLVTLLLGLCGRLQAQVIPPPRPSEATGTLPQTLCVDQVATGLYSTGLLRCETLTPALAPGLVPSGVDVSASGQVTSTHLSAPLPLAQGGLGLATGTPGGFPYFSGPDTVVSTATFALNAPILGGGFGQSPVPGTLSGTTRELASVLGPNTPNRQLTFDANGNIIASATDIGGGGSLTLPLPVPQGGTGLTAGVAGGLLYFPTPAILASSPSYALNAPLFGGGPGAAPLAGTLSGTTRTLASVLGPPTPQKQLTFDANGNVVASTVNVGSVDPVPLPVPQGGTGVSSGAAGGLLFFSTPTTLAPTPPYALNAPLLGGGLGQAPIAGALSGSTRTLVTLQGLTTPGKQLGFDPQGNVVASAFDLGGIGPAPITSVFGRTGVVTAQAGDYTAAQVTNTADVTGANVFTHPSGQSMRQLVLPGQVSGSVTLRAPGVAGNALLVFPPGQLDLSTTGGAGAVLRQQTAGGPLTVAALSLSDLSGGTGVCTTASVCAGYQASLGFTAENVANKDNTMTLGTSPTRYPTQNAVKQYVDTVAAGKQNTLGFAAEDAANKDNTATLGTSTIHYPTQGAVKLYVDTTVASLQPVITWGPGLAFSGGTA